MVHDRWGDGCMSFRRRAIREWVDQRQFDELVTLLNNIQLSKELNVWWWTSEGIDSFTMKQTRNVISNLSLPDKNLEMRWNQYMLCKVNILVWHALWLFADWWNSSQKGVDLDLLLYPLCSKRPKEFDHIMWSCEVSSIVWKKMFKWLHLVP